MGHAHSQTLAIFSVDHSSTEPPYRQLQQAVVSAIAEGNLLPGQQLPTVRALASHLGLATNTVASAYRALEASGVLVGKGRAGTFVSLGDNPVTEAARRIAVEACRELAKLGLSAPEAEKMFQQCLTVAYSEQ